MIERIARNEIRKRAQNFVKTWENAKDEKKESQTFWNEFFHVFGKNRREISEFEHAVKKLGKQQGFIDLFWPGYLVIEQKSRGKDLEKAENQAFDYLAGLKKHEKPRYVMVSDFRNFVLRDLEEGTVRQFEIGELPDQLALFDFIAGYDVRIHAGEDPANIQAAERMGKLHDALAESGYSGHDLELFLVRILFCVFAEDSGIFHQDHAFEDYIRDETREDGSDLGIQLGQIFQVLNTPEDRRSRHLNELLQTFPYVNGKLFADLQPMPSFDSDMRNALLECCAFDWKDISPEIFGALFQSIMDREKRRNLGAHYTSERNILKLIQPLFLDELWEELEKAGKNRRKLEALHSRLAGLRFLDPACGCGNFLIVTYRELRKLELEALRRLYPRKKGRQLKIDVLNELVRVNVDQFYGIEIEEFPARIAEVALWLTDHQMNRKISAEFGAYYVRIPLTHAPVIFHGNALKTDWRELVSPENLFCILGNPPFVAKHLMSKEQHQEMTNLFSEIEGNGVLDYVCAWHYKAAKYIQGTRVRCAFVSTNSISQGEQAGILWKPLLEKYHIRIHFAHRTFQWTSEARGKAAVFCIIIGFAAYETEKKWLFEYENPKAELPERQAAKNINPYLVDASDIVIQARRKPLCDVPQMNKGSQPTDGGNLILDTEQKERLLLIEPDAEKFIKPFVSAKEFLHNNERWCLWLTDIQPHELKKLPELASRVKNVRELRLKSKKNATVRLADMPTLFAENRQPDSDYILVPRHSSENRKYVPFGFFSKDFIVADSCISLPNATLYHFGVISSLMHMEWMRYIAGRLKSDYRYSNTLVYNNFPWPENPSNKQRQKVEAAAQAVLDIRAQYPQSSLADLYDPLAMPPELVKAHQSLDKAVDACYGKRKFSNERERVEFLFEQYRKLSAEPQP